MNLFLIGITLGAQDETQTLTLTLTLSLMRCLDPNSIADAVSDHASCDGPGWFCGPSG